MAHCGRWPSTPTSTRPPEHGSRRAQRWLPERRRARRTRRRRPCSTHSATARRGAPTPRGPHGSSALALLFTLVHRPVRQRRAPARPGRRRRQPERRDTQDASAADGSGDDQERSPRCRPSRTSRRAGPSSSQAVSSGRLRRAPRDGEQGRHRPRREAPAGMTSTLLDRRLDLQRQRRRPRGLHGHILGRASTTSTPRGTRRCIEIELVVPLSNGYQVGDAWVCYCVASERLQHVAVIDQNGFRVGNWPDGHLCRC